MIYPLSMCRSRKRIGDAGADPLLNETFESWFKIKAVKAFMFTRVNTDIAAFYSAIGQHEAHTYFVHSSAS